MKAMFLIFKAVFRLCLRRPGAALCLLPLWAASLQATAYRGIQTPLIMAWDDPSVNKLIETVAAAQTSLPANRFEIAALYITETLPKHADGTVRNRWDNIRHILDCLATVPAPPHAACPATTPKSPVDVKVRLFFDLHAFGGLSESADLAILKSRVAEFNTRVFKDYGNRSVFRLSPLLEEEPAISFGKFAQTIAENLDPAMVCAASTYPRFIRSWKGSPSPTSVTVSLKCPGSVASTSKTISVSLEWHDASPRTGFDAWSNDGIYVYDPSIEDKSLTANADGSIAPEKLDSFIQNSGSVNGLTSLLWRPRYNLMLYKHKGASVVCQTKPAPLNQQLLAYCASTSERGTISQRIASTAGAVFDATEASVLRTFLTKAGN